MFLTRTSSIFVLQVVLVCVQFYTEHLPITQYMQQEKVDDDLKEDGMHCEAAPLQNMGFPSFCTGIHWNR